MLAMDFKTGQSVFTKSGEAWIVCTQDANRGDGGWAALEPFLITEEDDYDELYARHQYNSMVDFEEFSTKEEALSYQNDFNGI
jgi:hypothetical protein